MYTVTRTGLIEAPATAVWARLADFGSIAAWAPNVDHSCLLSEQAAGVGMSRRVQAGRMTLVETVTHWEPGAALSYSLAGLASVVRTATNTWRIGSSGAATMVTVRTEIDAGHRPPQLAIARAVGSVMAKASDDMIAGLNAAVTRTGPGVNQTGATP